MTTNRTIVLDCDGVIFDFTTSMCEYARKHGYLNVTPDKVQNYYFMNQDFGMSQDEAVKLFYKWVEDGNFATQNMLPQAQELFKFLKELDFNIVLATHVPPQGQEDRLSCLKKHGLLYDAIQFTKDKRKAVLELEADIIVEDYHKHLEDCLINTNATVAWVEYPWNKKWIDDFEEHHKQRTWHLGNNTVALANLMRRIAQEYV